MTRNVVRIAVLGLLVAGATAQEVDPQRAFYRGNELFEAQEYDQAIAAYAAALAAGFESAPLHFNLGNAYLFSDRHGRALHQYRLAARLAPRDEDVQKNLSVARARAVDKIHRPAAPRFVQNLLFLHQRTTPSEAFTLFAACWLLGMALLHLRLFTRRAWLLRVAVPLLVLGLLMGISLGARSLGIGERREGVVLEEQVDVFTGPSDTAYSVYFKLHAGAEVEILEVRDGWVKIAVDADRRGYVPAQHIGLI